MGKRELTDRALMTEAVAYWGPTRTATIMGWAALAAVFNVQDARDFTDHLPIGGLSTRYKVVAAVRGFADELRSKGYELDEPDPVRLLERAIAGARA